MNDHGDSATQETGVPLVEPAIEPPPVARAERRIWAGWIALAILLSLMFVDELAASLTVPTKTTKEIERPYESALELEVSGRRFAAATDTSGGDETASELSAKMQESLDTPISTLVERSHTDLEAAREYGAMRTEQKLSVPAVSLAPLLAAKDARDRALAKVFGAKTLSLTEAQRISAELPDEPFVYQLAKVQALEKAGDRGARDRTFTGGLFLASCGAVIGVMTILFGSGVIWMVYLRARKRGQPVPLGTPANPQTLADADRLAVRAAQILGTFLLLSVLTTTRSSPGDPAKGLANASAITGLLILVALPLIARLPVGKRLITLEMVGLTLQNFGRHVLWGIGGFLFEFPLACAMGVIGSGLFSFLPAPTHPAEEALLHAKDLAAILPILFFGSVTAPIWEEFVFRGLLFPALGRVFGRILPAALVTGFVFAMVHPQGISAWLALATVGCIGCALTYQTRSLIPTIVMHMIHNSVLFIGLLMGMARV